MSLNNIRYLLLLFSIFLLYTQQEELSHQLSVISPPSLKDAFPDRIPFALANFGQIPYGKKLIGQVLLADPIDGCSQYAFNNGSQSTSTETLKKNVFLMVERGNCTFVSKARYAELATAKMLIVIDDIEEKSESVVMVEDGHGNEIYIPTILIRKEDGELFKSYISDGDKVELLVSFVLKKYDKLNYMFWLDVDNRESFRLISDFKQYHKQLVDKKLVSFTPHYQLFNCSWCEEFEQMKTLCLNHGAYCANDPDQRGPGTGVDSMLEIVRQICVFQKNPYQWWDYMGKVDLECVKPSEFQICSAKVEKELNLQSGPIEQCFKSSFKPQLSNMEQAKNLDNTYENAILENEMKQLNTYNTHLWPAITIEGIAYTGNLQSEDILSEFCASFNSPPASICKKYTMEYDEGENGDDGPGVFFIFMIIFVIIIFIAIMYFVYQRIVKKELSQNVGTEVNTMVNQYIAFYEKQEKK